MCDCEQHRSMDIITPVGVYLSPFYKRSFAFYTVHKREPIIITGIIDTLSRNKATIGEHFGEEGLEDLKKVLGELSKLKYEIVTNKELTFLTGTALDIPLYNGYLKQIAEENGPPLHFHTIWLLQECYVYRRISNIFENTKVLNSYDCCQTQKETAFYNGLSLMSELAAYLLDIVSDMTLDTADSVGKEFTNLLKINMWGNKCDLSITLGQESQHDSSMFNTENLEPFVLADDCSKAWNAIVNDQESDIIDIVLDNSGYELFTDCCLADFLIRKKLCNFVRFYVKSRPWFISDVTTQDFHWMVQQLKVCSSGHLNKLAEQWEIYLKRSQWMVEEHQFWTLPVDFTYMAHTAPELYEQLGDSKIVFYKGDLNYRKLFGERNWPVDTSIEDALQGYFPCKMCTLRTVKSHIIIDVDKKQVANIALENPNWMSTGNYGVIQYCGKIVFLDDPTFPEVDSGHKIIEWKGHPITDINHL